MARAEHLPQEFVLNQPLNCHLVPKMVVLTLDIPREHPRWKEHPERVSSMKNMSHSELSRRRLAAPKRSAPENAAEPSGEVAEQPAEVSSNEGA